MLTGANKEAFDVYDENGEFEDFEDYKGNIVFGSSLEITKDELKNVYLRTIDYDYEHKKLEYFQPFK